MMRRALLFTGAVALAATSFAPAVLADEEALTRAMRDEMARSVESLQLEDLERPYFIEYRIDDVHQHVVTASFGALVDQFPSRSRTLNVDVRVGDHDLDNSEFISTDLFRQGRFAQSHRLALDGDYYALRRALWSATDDAYKIGLEVLAKKRAHRENNVPDEPVPDFSQEEPHVFEGEVIPYEIDTEGWEQRVRKASGIFHDFPAIDESKVELRVQHLVRYYLNSEGSQYRKTEPCAILYASAKTHSDDGATLKDFVQFIERLPADLPGEDEFEEAVRQLAAELTALRSAPEIDDYTGPVLFSGTAAADLMVEAVGLQCVGQRVPEADVPQFAQMMPTPKLADRIGRRAMSDFITVYDDPTTATFGDEKLAGMYAVDDQGVPAQKVTLIEDGTVTSLLMSRRPRTEIPKSNGHARMPLFGVIGSDATIGNLFVESSEPLSFEELKKELVTICQDEGLEFGVIIRRLDDPALTGVDVDAQSMSALFQRQSMGGISLGAPLLAYRVYAADGREELVRGFDGINLSIRALRDIVALGDDAAAYNQMLAAGGGMFSGMGTQGFRISQVVPAAVVTPSVLFEEFDLKGDGGAKKKAPVLAHPSFE